MGDVTERTFIMVKPDGVQRGLVGKIIKRFEQKGFKLVGMKFVWVSVRARSRVIILRLSHACVNEWSCDEPCL